MLVNKLQYKVGSIIIDVCAKPRRGKNLKDRDGYSETLRRYRFNQVEEGEKCVLGGGNIIYEARKSLETV